jgi:hypothetical protein
MVNKTENIVLEFLRSLALIEKFMPFKNSVHLNKKFLFFSVEYEGTGNKFQQIEALKPFYDRLGGGFLEDKGEFRPYSFTPYFREKIESYGILDKVQRMLANLETEADFKTDGPENPGGVLNKAQTMEHPDCFLLDVSLGAEEIDKFSEGIFVK